MLGKKKIEIGLKEASEMNVFLKVWRVWGPWRHTSPHTPLGCPPWGGGDTDQFYCVLFRERCPSGNSFLMDGPLEKFFRYQIPCMIFFRPQHEYFLGVIGVHKFFSFNFPLREYFSVLRPPPPPISFLMVRPL